MATKRANGLAKAKFNKKGNIKVGAIWTWSTLYGSKSYYNKNTGKTVRGTCHNCEGCEDKCYVKASYRYPSVIEGHSNNTLAIRDSVDETMKELDGLLARRKTHLNDLIVRVDQSGELENTAQFLMFCKLARRHPNVSFFVYTKAYDIVIDALESGLVPENFVVLVSIWHEYGINEYKRISHFKNVKAFVYDDGFDYKKYGIAIDCHCPAYQMDNEGNVTLRHDITCDICGLCHVVGRGKVIACYPH